MIAVSLLTLVVVASFQIAPTTGFATVSYFPSRIIGGTSAAANEFPYQISLRYGGGHICGGSIISSTKVLTAAHCIISTTPSSFSVKAGALYRSISESTNQIRSVTSLVTHAQYSSSTTVNDIAVVTLSSPLAFNSAVQAIPLAAAGSEQAAGTNLVVTGWGTTSEGGSSSQNLLKATVPLVSQATCRSAYGTSKITNGMLCAGVAGKDSCQGDSGGPLATMSGTKTLVGVTSFGRGCGRSGYPGVYTKVSAYRPWIQTYAGV